MSNGPTPPFGGFGKQVKAGDVDGDGIDEIVGTLQSVGIAIMRLILKPSHGKFLPRVLKAFRWWM